MRFVFGFFYVFQRLQVTEAVSQLQHRTELVADKLFIGSALTLIIDFKPQLQRQSFFFHNSPSLLCYSNSLTSTFKAFAIFRNVLTLKSPPFSTASMLWYCIPVSLAMRYLLMPLANLICFNLITVPHLFATYCIFSF